MNLSELQELRQLVLTREGLASFVDTGGDGPVTVFVHGIATNAAIWRRPIGFLRTDRRCVAIELPLHGRTPARPDQDVSLRAMARFVEGFCDALHLEDIDLVAHDTGGAIAQVFAAGNPHRLHSLVLTNCDTEGNMPPRAFRSTVRLARAGLLAPILRSLRHNRFVARRQVFGSGYEDVRAQPLEVTADLLEPIIGSRAGARLFQRWVADLDDAELAEAGPALRTLRIPTMMVWGTGDPFFHISWAHGLDQQVRGSRGVVEVPGGKLFFPDERPVELVKALRDFYATLPAGTSAGA